MYLLFLFPFFSFFFTAACRFIISLNEKDINLLKNIKSFFKVGNIYFMANNSIQYRVESLEDLTVIIDHFDNHPLITPARPRQACRGRAG